MFTARPICTIICIIVLLSSNLYSQIRLDNWKAHTSLVNSQALEIDDEGKIWIASSGGVYSFYPDGSDFEVYRNIHQMLNINITALKSDKKSGRLYTGSNEGIVDILEPDGKWLHITDIYNQKFANPVINDFAFHGDNVFIAGGFGVAVFDSKRNVFLETAKRFADFNANNPANKITIHNDTIWVAVNDGITFADVNTTLANPSNWIGIKSNPGLFESSIKDIIINQGTVYAMSDKFITKLVDGELEEYQRSEFNLTALGVNNTNEMYFSTIFDVFKYDLSRVEIKHPGQINGFLHYSDNEYNGFIIIYNNNGIGLYLNGEYSHFLPDSPLLNTSTDLTVDQDGNLWVATDVAPNGRGFSKYDGITWKNFDLEKYPEIKTNNYHAITPLPDGRLAAASYGRGLLIIEQDDDEYNFRHFDTSNSKLFGLSANPSYIVCGKPRFDSKNNIWTPVLGEQSVGASLIAFDKEYNSYGFNNVRNPVQRYFYTLGIDLNGTKWVGGSRITGLGLMYYNERGTLDDNSDDIGGFISASDYPNLPDNTHTWIESDLNGFVWIGTPRGVAVISNPNTVMSNNPNINVRNLSRLIGGPYVNHIMVDAQNNKWIATNSGVWVVNTDGSDTVSTINMSNSPLPTNDVISLGYNKFTGQVFFGTKLGIYEAKSMSLQPSQDYSLECYPQPFNPDKDLELIIDGLEEFSDIRIVTSSGDFVNRIFSSSRKTIWNGRDRDGNKVPSGVYLILATSSSSKNSAVHKVAVVRNE